MVPLPESQVPEVPSLPKSQVPEVPSLQSQVPESQAPENVAFACLAALAEFQELENAEFAALAAAQAARRATGVPPSGPKAPKPEPETPHDIEEVIRQEIKATNDVPISVSASSSIVPAVHAVSSLPSLMVAAPSLQQPLRRVPHTSGQVFESRLDLEIGVRVFSRILDGAPSPFAGSPDLRPGGIDTSVDPSWLLFGWGHALGKFGSVYSVVENPNHGDQGF
jgi:hypothetical protein